MILPWFTKGSLGSNKVNISYDNFGNTVQIIKEGGTPVSYLWGYGGSLDDNGTLLN